MKGVSNMSQKIITLTFKRHKVVIDTEKIGDALAGIFTFDAVLLFAIIIPLIGG